NKFLAGFGRLHHFAHDELARPARLAVRHRAAKESQHEVAQADSGRSARLPGRPGNLGKGVFVPITNQGDVELLLTAKVKADGGLVRVRSLADLGDRRRLEAFLCEKQPGSINNVLPSLFCATQGSPWLCRRKPFLLRYLVYFLVLSHANAHLKHTFQTPV